MFVSIRRSEVPAYLQNGELFRSFDDENDDEISVPSDCIKMDTNVSSPSELDHFLSTVRYWIVSPFITELMDYTVNNKVSKVRNVLAKYNIAFPALLPLVKDIHQMSRTQRTCDLSAKHGCVEFMKYFVERNKPLDLGTLKIAALHGHVECVSYCVEYLTSRGRSTHIDIMDWRKVIQRGHVDCVRFLLQHGMPIRPQYTFLAAAAGQLACLKLLLTHKPDHRPELALSAVENNHLNCLKYIVEQKDGYDVSQQTWEVAITAAPSINANKGVAVGIKGPRSRKVSNHRCLAYLLSTGSLPDNPSVLINLAIRADKVTALRLLYQHGVAVNSATVLFAAECKSTQCLQYLLEQCQTQSWVLTTMAAAAGAGQLQLVKYLHEQGWPWDETAPIAALKAGYAECFEYLIYQRGLPTSEAFTSISPSLSCNNIIMGYKMKRKYEQFQEDMERKFVQLRHDVGVLMDRNRAELMEVLMGGMSIIQAEV